MRQTSALVDDLLSLTEPASSTRARPGTHFAQPTAGSVERITGEVWDLRPLIG